MKKTLILSLLLIPLAVIFAQEYKSRVQTPSEERYIAGTVTYVQDELLRNVKPRFVNGLLFYAATNYYDGVVLCRSNATVLVHVGLPNPTNHPNRKYEVTTLDACTATLSNHHAVGTFTDMLTLTNSTVYFIASNKTAVAYSTGSNWIVRLH